MGSRLRRHYHEAQTPLDRLCESLKTTPALSRMLERRKTTDPFQLSHDIEHQLKHLAANQRQPKKHAA